MDDPLGGAQGTTRKNSPVAGFVRQLDAFTERGEQHGMITDDVAAPQCVNPDFCWRALADNALAAVAQR